MASSSSCKWVNAPTATNTQFKRCNWRDAIFDLRPLDRNIHTKKDYGFRYAKRISRTEFTVKHEHQRIAYYAQLYQLSHGLSSMETQTFLLGLLNPHHFYGFLDGSWHINFFQTVNCFYTQTRGHWLEWALCLHRFLLLAKKCFWFFFSLHLFFNTFKQQVQAMHGRYEELDNRLTYNQENRKYSDKCYKWIKVNQHKLTQCSSNPHLLSNNLKLIWMI